MNAMHHLCVGIVALIAVVAVAPADADVERFLQIVPDDAVAVVAVPHLRNVNDEIVQMLDGMDRSTVLFGARPIDAVKSIVGMSVAVNELRPAGVVVIPVDDDPLETDIVWLVPVTSLDAFLSGNFDRLDEQPNDDALVHRVRHRRFGELYVTRIGESAAMAKRSGALQAWRATGGVAQQLRRRLDDDGRDVLHSGDIVIWVADCSSERWTAVATAWLDRLERQWPAAKPLRSLFTALCPAQCADGIAAIDFDPLGLFVRGWLRIKEDADPALARPDHAPAHLRALPREPYQLALAMDQRGMTLSQRISDHLGWDRLARSFGAIAGAEQFDFAAYEGSPSGILGRAVGVLHGTKQEIDNEMHQAMLEWEQVGHGITWRQSAYAPPVEGALAHEYAVRLSSEAMGRWGMLPPLLFGPASWQGYVFEASRRTVMTFNRAARSRDLAVAALGGVSDRLADDPVICSMNNWLPENPAIVGYASMSGLMEQIMPILRPMFSMNDARLPDVPPGLPPVAGAVAVDENSAQARIIIPAGVLAIGYDLAGERFIRQRFLTPKRDVDDSEDGSAPSRRDADE